MTQLPEYCPGCDATIDGFNTNYQTGRKATRKLCPRDCGYCVDCCQCDDEPRSIAPDAYTRTGVYLGELRDV